ncbi:MAG: DUF1015 domain-containing protein [Phycisphaerae bacterium]
MSNVRPLRAIRYANAAGRDLGARLAPPYDVLDQRDKDALLARDPRNFVKLDLPHVPPKVAGPPAAYAAAADTLRSWLADKTLVRDDRESIYVYHQTYTHGSETYVRKMFFARLRLEPFGTGAVFPHEQTFGGPKEDRLCLMRATAANLSPIFGLYEDATNQVAQRLEQALGPEPAAHGTLDGVENRLWVVSDTAAIADVTRLMSAKAIYIADGHHRYGTSLIYRESLKAEGAALPAEHPANYTLCVFCAMEDAGLLILPTHRALPGVRVTAAQLQADGELAVGLLEANDADGALRAVAQLGPQALGAYLAGENRYVSIRPKRADLLDALEPKHSLAWRRLALSFLHAYLLDRVVTPKLNAGRAPDVHYIKSASAAIDDVSPTGGTAFLMQPTTMEELRAVCQANDLMPQKSTFFFPKLASGLVINPLD